jgi:hypothetical protein
MIIDEMERTDYTEAIFKMDKWAYDDWEVQEEFYQIIDDVNLTVDEKVAEIESMLPEMIIQDEDRLESYLYGDQLSYHDLAVALVEYNS